MNNLLTLERIERFLDYCYPERPGAQERSRKRLQNRIDCHDFYFPIRAEFSLGSGDGDSGENCYTNSSNCDRASNDAADSVGSDLRRNPFIETSVIGNSNESPNEDSDDEQRSKRHSRFSKSPRILGDTSNCKLSFSSSSKNAFRSNELSDGKNDGGVEDDNEYPDVGVASMKLADDVFGSTNKEKNNSKKQAARLRPPETETYSRLGHQHSLHGSNDSRSVTSDVEMPRGCFNLHDSFDEEMHQGFFSPLHDSDASSSPHPSNDSRSPRFQFQSPHSLGSTHLNCSDHTPSVSSIFCSSPLDAGSTSLRLQHSLSPISNMSSHCHPNTSGDSFDTPYAAKEWIRKWIGTIVDVDGDGNCGYRAIIQAFAHTKKAFKVDSLPDFGETKSDLLTLRKSFKKWCLENLQLFMESRGKTPVIGWGKELCALEFLPFYKMNNLNNLSLEEYFNEVAGDMIYSDDERDYFPSNDDQKKEIFLDALKHLPLFAYMHKTTIICYGIPRFQIIQETQQRRLVEASTTTFCVYHPDIERVQCFVEPSFMIPPPNVSIITLSGEHFQWVRARSTPEDAEIIETNQQSGLENKDYNSTKRQKVSKNVTTPGDEQITREQSDGCVLDGLRNGSIFQTMNSAIARQDLLDFINNAEGGRRPYLIPVPWSSDEIPSFTFALGDVGKLFVLDWYEGDVPQKQNREGSLLLKHYWTRGTGNYQRITKYLVVGDAEEDLSMYHLCHFQFFFNKNEIKYESAQENVVFHAIAIERKNRYKRKREFQDKGLDHKEEM